MLHLAYNGNFGPFLTDQIWPSSLGSPVPDSRLFTEVECTIRCFSAHVMADVDLVPAFRSLPRPHLGVNGAKRAIVTRITRQLIRSRACIFLLGNRDIVDR